MSRDASDAPVASPPGTLLRRALPFALPHRARLAAVVALALFVAALGAVEPLVLKRLFDELGGERDARALLS